MVHLRARNLKSKAILKRWLFSGEEAIFGEDFALVELEDGSEVKIKSNYNGLIAKTIKIGSHIKNGSILANIVIGDLEIEKYKKESLKKTEVKIINSQELNIKSESLNSNRTGSLNSNKSESLNSNKSESLNSNRTESLNSNRTESLNSNRTESLNSNRTESLNSNGTEYLNSNRTEEKEYVKVSTINNNVISNKNMESTIVSDFNKKYVDNSSIKSQENKEVNEIMSESNMQPKDKFAQMRLSIKESIKNAPQHKYNGDLSKEELLKITPEEVRKSDSTNLFSTDNVSGVSKFRQLVQARKEKLLEENNFKEVKDNAGEINAMSKTDEKGRPLIMRNIIQARIEKLNSAGGDTRVLQSDIVATKDNAILDHQRVENNSEQQKHLQEDNNEFKQGSDVKNQNVENISTFKRENNVSNESYFKEKKSTLVDSNDAIDYSEATMSKDNSNKFDEENNSKSNWNYADTKISNLHDTRKRWNVIKNHDDRAAIRQRREAIEQGLTEDNLSFSKKIKEIGIPQEFLREVLYQDPESGATNYVLYNETPKGRIEFENWLRTTNLYSAYKAEKRLNEKNQGIEFDSQMNNKDLAQNEEQDSYKNRERDLYKKIHLKISENENLKTIDNELDQTMQFETVNTAEFDRDEIPEKTPKVIQKEIKTQISKKDDELVKVYDKKIADETLDFLKAEIKELHRTLKEQNQLHAATSKLNQQSNFNAGPDTFGQMMQYMLMQNMMQNMNQNKVSNRDISASDLKSVIKEEINSFANELKDKKRKEEEQILLEQEIIAKVERQFREKYERERYQEEQLHHEQKEAKRVQRKEENIRDINFEVDKPDNSVGYLQFESNDENKVIEREKVNKNRNSAVKSMILSQNFIPPLTISTEIDMSSILKLKHMLKQTQNHIKFTTISFIAKSISIALEEYPKLNSSYDPETNEVIIKKYHNIGLATETSEGLIIPVLKFVDRLSIKEVAIDIKEMTSRLRAGELLNYESEGSTITISNYGNIGAIQATPTIFYPNAAVIGVGKVVKKPVVVDNEKLAIKAIMHMSLTIDQRIIDAAEAGKFLAKVKAILEKPEILTVS